MAFPVNRREFAALRARLEKSRTAPRAARPRRRTVTAAMPDNLVPGRMWEIAVPDGLKLLNSNDRYPHWSEKACRTAVIRGDVATPARSQPHYDRTTLQRGPKSPTARSFGSGESSALPSGSLFGDLLPHCGPPRSASRNRCHRSQRRVPGFPTAHEDAEPPGASLTTQAPLPGPVSTSARAERDGAYVESRGHTWLTPACAGSDRLDSARIVCRRLRCLSFSGGRR